MPELALDNLSLFEQYLTTEVDKLAEVLDSLDLKDRKVLEIGIGQGAITNLLLERGALVTGYEVDPNITPDKLRSKIDYQQVDYKIADLSYLEGGDFVLIANPPYKELPRIREKIIDAFKLRDYILCIPAAQRMLFPEAEVVACLQGSDFTPEALGQHLIIKSSTKNRELIDLQVENLKFDWVDLKNAKLPVVPLNSIEEQFMNKLVEATKARIADSKIQEDIVLLITADLDKLCRMQETYREYGKYVLQAEMYSHPEYLRRLRNLPEVFAVVRAESRGDEGMGLIVWAGLQQKSPIINDEWA